MNLNVTKNNNRVNATQNINIETVLWKLFELTGEIRYYNLCKAIENENFMNYEQENKNQLDREL